VLPWSADLAGRIDEQVIGSELLRGNPLGDPHERPLPVYLPPGYDDEPDRRYPSVYLLQGYGGHVAMWRNRSAFRQPFPEAADAVFARGEAPPAIVVYVDAWTGYGGSQFGAMATHAGDTLYEYCYIPGFASAARHLRRYGGDIWRWWEDFGSRVAFTKEEDMPLLGLLGVAACFSPNADGTVDLPFDPATGVLRSAVWQRWLDWDPVRMVPAYADALRGLRAIWIDAGTRDEYYLDLGAEAFRSALRDVGVADGLVHFELFEAGHGGIDYRYPMSLAWLCGRITK